MKAFLSVFALLAGLLLPIALVADHDIDLPVNGDFRGASRGNSPASGWTLTEDGGSARILPTDDADEFALELTAGKDRSQSVVSDLFPLPGNRLKLDLDVRGTGRASAGFEAYDASRSALAGSGRKTVALTGNEQKLSLYFTLPAKAKYVRIRLTAEARSVAQFSDVDAEVSSVVSAPANGVTAVPPAAAPK